MYELQRRNTSRWTILKNGTPVGYFRTKRDANIRVLELREHDAYIAPLFRTAETGIYEWTPDESREIDSLADALRENSPRSIEESSRKKHELDAKTIEQWETGFATSEHGKEVCAELRHRRAAREEAFKRAGMTL